MSVYFVFLHWRLQYHGGTNFGRTASGLFVATSYDYDAPIDEYGTFQYHTNFKSSLFCKLRIKWHMMIKKDEWLFRATSDVSHSKSAALNMTACLFRTWIQLFIYVVVNLLGLLNEPKWGHLRDLHKAIKQCEPAMVSTYPTVIWLGKNHEVNWFQLVDNISNFIGVITSYFLNLTMLP